MVLPPRAGLACGGDRRQNKPEPQLAACTLFRGKGVGQRRPAVGPCPPVERRTFSTAQIFMSTIFSKKRSEQTWEVAMNRTREGLGCAVALMIGASAAQAQGTVKIGLINVLSGQFADAGIQLDNGVKTYMKQHG